MPLDRSRPRRLSWSAARVEASRHSDGFTLVEVVVAMAIATIALMALSFTLIGTVKAAAFSRENQQAGDVLNQVLEKARALPVDSLSMRSTDLNTNDGGRTPAVGSCTCYNPTNDSTSGTGVESLVLDPAGAVSPHVSTAAGVGSATFLTKQYVTVPTDATGASYKRLTVVVTWTTRGQAHKRITSTLISPTKRGLPLPDFKFTINGGSSQCRNPGSGLLYAFTLRNNGARDAWLFTSSSSPFSWTYYADVNNNQAYDSGVDTVLPSGGTSSLPSTGLLEPLATARVIAVATIASSTATGTYGVIFSATSAADGTYSQSQTTTTLVQTAVCAIAPTASPTASVSPSPTPSPTSTPTVPAQPGASCSTLNSTVVSNVTGQGTVQAYSLHNGATNTTNTTTVATMPFDKLAPTATTLWQYSSDRSAEAGRLVAAPAGSLTSSDYVVEWKYQVPAATQVKGNGLVLVYLAGASFASVTPTIQVNLDHIAGTTTTALASSSWSGTVTCASGFTGLKIQLPMPNSGENLAASDTVRLRIKVTAGSAVKLAYDTTSFGSVLQLPLSSGVG